MSRFVVCWWKLVYKFAGQPIVNDLMNKHFKKDFINTFGADHAKTWMHATSGAMIGVGEIVLLPLDVLKIISQTNPGALKGRGVVKIVVEENFKLYRGAAWTAARNAPGSFALFGGAAAAKEYIFKLKDYNQATFFQNSIASVIGSVASIVLSNPLDVIKTRIQNRNFDNPESGASILRKLVRDEGMGAFFKGVIPKTAVVGPKLGTSSCISFQLAHQSCMDMIAYIWLALCCCCAVFSFTIAQSLITYFDAKLAVRDAHEKASKSKTPGDAPAPVAPAAPTPSAPASAAVAPAAPSDTTAGGAPKA